MNLNNLQQKALASPYNQSLWEQLAKDLLAIGDLRGANLATNMAETSRIERDNRDAFSQRAILRESQAKKEKAGDHPLLTELLETARQLLEQGLSVECVGICKYIRSKAEDVPHLRAWSIYLHGAAKMEQREYKTAISLLSEAISLQEISYAALLLADYYSGIEDYDKAYSYYSFALKWEPLIQGSERTELERKAKQAASDFQTSRLVARQRHATLKNRNKPSVLSI